MSKLVSYVVNVFEARYTETVFCLGLPSTTSVWLIFNNASTFLHWSHFASVPSHVNHLQLDRHSTTEIEQPSSLLCRILSIGICTQRSSTATFIHVRPSLHSLRSACSSTMMFVLSSPPTPVTFDAGESLVMNSSPPRRRLQRYLDLPDSQFLIFLLSFDPSNNPTNYSDATKPKHLKESKSNTTTALFLDDTTNLVCYIQPTLGRARRNLSCVCYPHFLSTTFHTLTLLNER